MNKTKKARTFSRTIKDFFSPPKGKNPQTMYPDAYYGRIAFDKKMYDGIELVAKIERTSKKKAARLLMERGFSSYMGDKIKTYIQSEQSAKILLQKPKPTRFVLELRKYARARGMDISKFF
jgi:hypothetical protein